MIKNIKHSVCMLAIKVAIRCSNYEDARDALRDGQEIERDNWDNGWFR